jgi:hypothetical protein
MPRDASDNEVLLQRALGGDCGALAELFERHRGRLEQMVRLRLDRRLQGRLDAADVLQEAYLDVARRFAVQAVTGTPSTRAPREFDRLAYSGVSAWSALGAPACARSRWDRSAQRAGLRSAGSEADGVPGCRVGATPVGRNMMSASRWTSIGQHGPPWR